MLGMSIMEGELCCEHFCVKSVEKAAQEGLRSPKTPLPSLYRFPFVEFSTILCMCVQMLSSLSIHVNQCTGVCMSKTNITIHSKHMLNQAYCHADI